MTRLLAALLALVGAPSPQSPEAAFALVAKAYFAAAASTGWEGIDQLPGFTWTSTVTELRNCLPNGDCYARQGRASVGGRTFTVVASGARTIVVNLLLRNTSAPLGEAAVIAAFGQVGLTAALARCPVRAGSGGTSWYRLTGADATPGIVSIQPASQGRPAEGFILTRSADLPTLPPNQLAAYTDHCAPGAERKPVASSPPHEALADAVVGLLVPATGPTHHDWTSLVGMDTGIRWQSAVPKEMNLSFKGDPNPVSITGEVTFSDRQFSVIASGTPTQVKAIHLDELGRHPRGEHMLGVVYERGIAVALVRCGPVYTESTNNWYGLTSLRTRPANIRQSINHDGNQVAETYELRLDGTLPARDQRDRNPGINGCR